MWWWKKRRRGIKRKMEKRDIRGGQNAKGGIYRRLAFPPVTYYARIRRGGIRGGGEDLRRGACEEEAECERLERWMAEDGRRRVKRERTSFGNLRGFRGYNGISIHHLA